MKNYSLSYCEELISKYVNKYEGYSTEIREGVLGLGTVILHGAKGKKSIIINEYYINEWVSGHSIRKYNRLPKKYKIAIDKY